MKIEYLGKKKIENAPHWTTMDIEPYLLFVMVDGKKYTFVQLFSVELCEDPDQSRFEKIVQQIAIEKAYKFLNIYNGQNI